ncbi:MAG: phosphoribosylanthranilate isomerase [Lachnospiraceae bacterium]|nr:phosphoribosylanthranilate isomerase [Lachnospiraceae bacterium]
MTNIKLCGLRRPDDIRYANMLLPEYVGFVFAKKSSRYVSAEEAALLRKQLDQGIIPVGVFVDEEPKAIADLLSRDIIAVAQLHGQESEKDILKLQEKTGCPVIKAFCIGSSEDIEAANESPADFVLLDSGKGSGKTFDWELLKGMKRPYFLAGGLTPENVRDVVDRWQPFGVDASSSLETDGYKDPAKMAAFVNAVRNGKDA